MTKENISLETAIWRLIDIPFIPTSLLRLTQRLEQEGKLQMREDSKIPKVLQKVITYGPPTCLEALRLMGYYELYKLFQP